MEFTEVIASLSGGVNTLAANLVQGVVTVFNSIIALF